MIGELATRPPMEAIVYVSTAASTTSALLFCLTGLMETIAKTPTK
jgi:hypothetical protein